MPAAIPRHGKCIRAQSHLGYGRTAAVRMLESYGVTSTAFRFPWGSIERNNLDGLVSRSLLLWC